MKKERISNKSLTDWARVDALTDQEIDLSECPEITPDMFKRAVVRRGLQPVPPKSRLTLQVDQDVLAWFQAQGRNYKVRINALLRAYMETHAKSDKSA
jgi:uncharacterized protein (DUF4415 family)